MMKPFDTISRKQTFFKKVVWILQKILQLLNEEVFFKKVVRFDPHFVR